MYVTVLKPAKVKTLSLEELIVNPFLPAPEQEKNKKSYSTYFRRIW